MSQKDRNRENRASDLGTSVPFKMHPRVFEALGADLVTNDVVAVIELVKNSYDAFAKRVDVRFGNDSTVGDYIEIQDNGQGMDESTIDDVWCVVATPFKKDNPSAIRGRKKRRVAGAKGLGRLSAARLGRHLVMLTQTEGGTCWEVTVDWQSMASADDISACTAHRKKFTGESPVAPSGTRIRISGPDDAWNQDQVTDLEENLARLISPFDSGLDFELHMTRPGSTETEGVKIISPEFLTKPKYSIVGNVDRDGNIECKYQYSPIRDGKKRTASRKLSWEQVIDSIHDEERRNRLNRSQADCGSFSYDIRAWDIGSDDAIEIAERFNLQKNSVRKAIRAHKGISVYRDGVLVLPKSERARDWLGLDLRRISRTGKRLSTNQLVGYVAISADSNPEIEDTSDRERLAESRAASEFVELLNALVGILENERATDKPDKEEPLKDLFEDLSAEAMIDEVSVLAAEGADASETVPVLRTFSAKLNKTKKAIEERFVYYSRLATVGTIAQMLVHEIRNRTTAFGSFLRFIKDRFGPFKDKDLLEEYRDADNAVNALERLADTFSPLASRSFRRRQRDSLLEERIRLCLEMVSGDVKRQGVEVSNPATNTNVAVDPGELDAILLNLLTNALYWLGQTPKGQRKLEFRCSPIDDGRRVRIWLHDSGPGIAEEDTEKVFWPGITRKPGGIGMGLTVASELVAEYDGKMTIKQPGTIGGASFGFDLPVHG